MLGLGCIEINVHAVKIHFNGRIKTSKKTTIFPIFPKENQKHKVVDFF
jgi:hypothetical protein